MTIRRWCSKNRCRTVTPLRCSHAGNDWPLSGAATGLHSVPSMAKTSPSLTMCTPKRVHRLATTSKSMRHSVWAKDFLLAILLSGRLPAKLPQSALLVRRGQSLKQMQITSGRLPASSSAIISVQTRRHFCHSFATQQLRVVKQKPRKIWRGSRLALQKRWKAFTLRSGSLNWRRFQKSCWRVPLMQF